MAEQGELEKEEPPLEKKQAVAKKKVTHCLGCDVPVESAEWPTQFTKHSKSGKVLKEGLGCLKCYKTWAMGNFLMTHRQCPDFDSFLAMLAKNKEEKTAFGKATRLREGSLISTYAPAEVTERWCSGWRASRSYIGLTREQFQARFQKSPQECGLKLKDLVNEQGHRYKGVLVVDPDRPEVRYVHYRDTDFARRSWRLAKKRKLQESQDARVHQVVVQEGEKSGMLQLLKACHLTVAQIEEKCGEQDAPEDDAAEEEEGDEEGDPEKDEMVEPMLAEEQEALGPVLGQDGALAEGDCARLARNRAKPQVLETPKMKRLRSAAWSEASPNVENVTPGTGPSTVLQSGGRRQSGGSCDGRGVVEGQQQVLSDVALKIKQLDVGAIWAGQKIGVQLRFATRLAKEIEKADPSGWAELTEAIRVANTAIEMVDTGIAKMDAAKLDSCVRSLSEACVVFAPNIQLQLLRRRCLDLAASTACTTSTVTELLQVCTPWTSQEAEEEAFQAWQPTCRSVEAEEQEKSDLFLEVVMGTHMCNLLKQGQAGASAVLTASRTALAYYAAGSLEHVPDAYIDLMSSCLVVWRALVSLIDPNDTGGLHEVDSLVAAKTRGVAACRMVSVMLATVPHYKKLVAEWQQNKPTQEMMRGYEEAQKRLQGSPAFTDIQQAATFWTEHGQGLRKALADNLLARLCAAVTTMHKEAESRHKQGMILEKPTLQELLGLYEHLNDHLPYEVLPAQDFLGWATDVQKEVTEREIRARFEQVLAKCENGCQDMTEEDHKAMALSPTVRMALAAASSKLAVDSAVAGVLAAWAVGSPEKTGEVTTMLRSLAMWPISGYFEMTEATKTTLEAVLTANDFGEAMKAWLAQGENDQARLKRDVEDVQVRGLFAQMKKLQESAESLGEGCVKDRLKEQLATVTSVVTGATSASSQRACEHVSRAMEATLEVVGEVLTAKKPWNEHLGEDTSWEHYVTEIYKILMPLDGEQAEARCDLLAAAYQRAQGLLEAFGDDPTYLADALSLRDNVRVAQLDCQLALGAKKYANQMPSLLKLARNIKGKAKTYEIVGKQHKAVETKLEQMLQCRMG